MSGLINYGSRANRRSPPSSVEEQSENPFSETTATNTNTNTRDGGNDAVYSSSEQDTGYDGYTDTSVREDGRGGADRMETIDESSRGGRRDDEPFFDPTFPSYEEEEPLEMAFFDHVVQDYGEMGIVGKTRLFVRQSLSFGLTLGALGGILVLAFAAYFNPFKKQRPRAKPDREYERRITGERLSGRPEYYAEFWGYHCDTHDIITEGGWILKAHRISDPRRGGPPGHPVILQHGILCNSSHFFVCEERSMAFWLVDQGYDVWVTNIRANFEAGHTEYPRSDPRFWAWGLKELAFDLRDVVEFICGATGKPRVAYVGHSQGSGSMYLALSPGICPELGRRLSSFTAIGPSVYAGPVLRKFPFSLMRQFRGRKWWSTVFGVKEFIPALALFQKYAPSFMFAHLAYVIFYYLFGFDDSSWVNRQKGKIFRTLPHSTSSELLYWYMASFSHRGCIFDPRQERWFPSTFPPHTIVYGTADYLVLGKPLADRMAQHESNVKMINTVALEGAQHLDFIMAVDAIRTTFPAIHDCIQSSLHPSERDEEMEEKEGGRRGY
ncbi:alpha/beta-hydrolase [Jaminaea rosea]|uniref:Alpha/beta-hydrolase n=1 Tax=Jaminaea rosea TaxID=1569628 RepID=A0A316UR80_9BASI|nr:alpha/beta-hydrolase [Jaminaea rosea]PWN27796.1 alpha/beta-hydrolase [Jaminaea rosea]